MLSDLKRFFTKNVAKSKDYYLKSENIIVYLLANVLINMINDIRRIRLIEDMSNNCVGTNMEEIEWFDIDSISTHWCDYFQSCAQINVLTDMILQCVFEDDAFELDGFNDCMAGLFCKGNNLEHVWTAKYQLEELKADKLLHRADAYINTYVDNYCGIFEKEIDCDDDEYEVARTADFLEYTRIHIELIRFKNKGFGRKIRKLYTYDNDIRNFFYSLGFTMDQGDFWGGCIYSLEDGEPPQMADIQDAINLIPKIRKKLGVTKTNEIGECESYMLDSIIKEYNGLHFRTAILIESILNCYKSEEEIIL